MRRTPVALEIFLAKAVQSLPLPAPRAATYTKAETFEFSSGETPANLAFVFGKIAADVGDAERAEDRSVRLAFEQKAETLFYQVLCIYLVAREAFDIAHLGGDVVERRLLRLCKRPAPFSSRERMVVQACGQYGRRNETRERKIEIVGRNTFEASGDARYAAAPTQLGINLTTGCVPPRSV
jgi:hypothetical protein